MGAGVTAGQRRLGRHAGLTAALAATLAVAALAALGALATARPHDGDFTHDGGALHAHALPHGASAAVLFGRLPGQLAAHLPGPAALTERLPLFAAALVAACVLYALAARTFGRGAATLSALLVALMPLNAAAIQSADPSAWLLVSGALALGGPLEAVRRRRPLWLLGALAVTALALLPATSVAASGAYARHLPVALFSLALPGSALGGLYVAARGRLRTMRGRQAARGRLRTMRGRQAALSLAWLIAAISAAALWPGAALSATVFAVPPSALMFGAGVSAMVRDLRRRGTAKYALPVWVATTAACEFALSSTSVGFPVLAAAALALGVGAALVLALARTPLFEAPGHPPLTLPVVIAVAAILAPPAAITLHTAAPHLLDRGGYATLARADRSR